MITLWLSLLFFQFFLSIFQKCLPLSILFAYQASGKMLKDAVGRCSSIFGHFSPASMKMMMIIRMIYVDENHHEYEDEFDDYDEEEEDVWAYSGNFLWRALTIQACLQSPALYHFLHCKLSNCVKISILYFTLFMHFIQLVFLSLLFTYNVLNYHIYFQIFGFFSVFPQMLWS